METDGNTRFDPQVSIQIDLNSLRVFSQADIDSGRVDNGENKQAEQDAGRG